MPHISRKFAKKRHGSKTLRIRRGGGDWIAQNNYEKLKTFNGKKVNINYKNVNNFTALVNKNNNFIYLYVLPNDKERILNLLPNITEKDKLKINNMIYNRNSIDFLKNITIVRSSIMNTEEVHDLNVNVDVTQKNIQENNRDVCRVYQGQFYLSIDDQAPTTIQQSDKTKSDIECVNDLFQELPPDFTKRMKDRVKQMLTVNPGMEFFKNNITEMYKLKHAFLVKIHNTDTLKIQVIMFSPLEQQFDKVISDSPWTTDKFVVLMSDTLTTSNDDIDTTQSYTEHYKYKIFYLTDEYNNAKETEQPKILLDMVLNLDENFNEKNKVNGGRRHRKYARRLSRRK